MTVELRHFKKAISNISKSGDNDTLPFDIDTKFIKNNEHNLAKLAFDFFQKNEKKYMMQ